MKENSLSSIIAGRRVGAVLAALAASLVAGPALPGQSALEPPRGVAVCQADYGPAGTMIISWTNPESYDTVELSVDGEPVPGEVDGAAGTGRVQAPPGDHVFAARGLVGDRPSEWVSAPFTTLAVSPLLQPITGLDCEFLPGRGGRLRLTWSAGPDAWVSGRVEVPGFTGFVAVPGGASSAEIEAPAEEPRIALLTFKNASGYYSPAYTPVCVRRTPAFRRGDCDGSIRINITDAVYELNHLFRGGTRWSCDDACDVNDDGAVNLSDPVYLLAYLFQSGSPPPAPGARACGIDPSGDFLGGVCGCP